MIDIKDCLNKHVKVTTGKKVNFRGLLSKVAHIKNDAGTKLSDILGWDYLVCAENGCYKFYAAQSPLIGLTEAEPTECPCGIQVITSVKIDIEKVIEKLSKITKSPFTDIELYWPLTPECKEPAWHIKTMSGSYIVIGANTGHISPSSSKHANEPVKPVSA